MSAHKTLSTATILLLIASVLVMGHKEAQFRYDPQAPDPSTAHIHPLAIRGVGTVYLTPAESDSLAPYVDGVYACFALVFVIIGGPSLYAGYRGFMRGWRS